MPKFSIIVPVYNTEKELPRCLDSLVGQTFSDIEIIVVNDGSPDNSKAVIDEYEIRYPQIIKSFTQENRGQSAARNLALKNASGEFVFFVDSDDYIDKDACEKTYAYASENDLDIVCFDVFTEIGSTVVGGDHCSISDRDLSVQYVLNEASPCNKIIRRSILSDNGLFFLEDHIYEDLQLIPRLALYTDKIGYMRDGFYHYVIRQGSTMRQKVYTKKLESIYYVMESLKEAFKGSRFEREGVVEYMFIEHLLHLAVYRYLDYAEGKADIKRIAGIMKKEYPRWRRNKFYSRKGFKDKVFCNLAYYKQVWLLKKLLKK